MGEGYVQKIEKDDLRAKSLIKTAEDTLLSVQEIAIKEHNYNTILRELYEALRQYCEAIGYLRGYKFQSHEVITYFLVDLLKEENISLRFDHYRKLRNGINYYGRAVSKETVEKALVEVPKLMQKMMRYLNI